ncbi:Bug family tripartite tricarboxylate transporter substrate binding protein [Cupriavidus necator]|uniref:Bug family tripartite tricarboxylate transporter substrate binding protein n=1 Tax=Cupriavidus necator TaxID=106590 RepID=UPI00278A45E9|nr:tripartite tricarboxylate transporter substrate binding protein [Cupriavidus necator]MDQ0142072.1 tripartite-type tricarboxylate transporter receptor subunit TctC [Cupriavidus necator]
MRLRRRLLVIARAAMVCALATAQPAPAYPNKPVRIVVPFAPGGTTDVLARILAQRMTLAWGQPVIVENKPGVGGTIGASMVAKAPADGYTLLLGTVHHTIAQAVYKNLSYNFGRDFAPVSVIAMVPNVVVVNTAVPAKTIEEFVALARSQPGELNYGTAGAGTAHHLIGEMFKQRAGVDFVHVPYKGSGPAVTDLMGGQVQVMFDTVTSALPHVKARNTRALAVTTAKRSSALPDVPTLAETVLPGFDVGTWFGIVAPRGTPTSVVEKIYGVIDRMVKTPEIRRQLIEIGAEPIGSTPLQMGAQIKAELSAYEALAKQSKVVVE